jgi:Flp pilus assembly protein TadD
MSHPTDGGTNRGMRLALVASLLAAALGCGASTSPEARPPMPDPLDGVAADELYGHGAALALQGDTVRAEQYVVAAIERGFSVAEALPLLIEVCVASNRLSSALSHAEPHLREHPEQWPLRHVIGTLYLGLGRIDDAQRELERVVAEAPDAPMPRFNLGMLLYEHRDDREAARPHLERYLELAPQGRHASEVRSVLASRPVQRIERLDVEALPEPAPVVEITAPGPGEELP